MKILSRCTRRILDNAIRDENTELIVLKDDLRRAQNERNKLGDKSYVLDPVVKNKEACIKRSDTVIQELTQILNSHGKRQFEG